MSINTSDIIASLALAISILTYLSENRGIRKQLAITNICEYTKRYQEIIKNLPKEVLADDFNLSNFSDKKQEEILRYMWLYFDLCYEEYVLYYELKLVDKKVWKIWESGIRSALNRPSFIQCWNIINENTDYGKDKKFTHFMRAIIKESAIVN